MGIRYYAYAFDADQTRAALADPRAFISSDPLADAWGMEPHVQYGLATFEQRTPKRDLLYLDKAWSSLQALTRPASPSARPRPAFLMFEGWVTWEPDGYGWFPWVRALGPDEMPAIAKDLGRLTAAAASTRLRRRGVPTDDIEYTLHYLGDARAFVEGLVSDGRGMAYLIG